MIQIARILCLLAHFPELYLSDLYAHTKLKSFNFINPHFAFYLVATVVLFQRFVMSSKLETNMSDVISKLQLLLLKPLIWIVFLLSANLLYKCYGNSLRRVPGPFLARFSNFWKLSAAWNQDMPKRNIEAHQKYGPVVRIGHNTVSVSDSSALATVYSFQAWDKVSRRTERYI